MKKNKTWFDENVLIKDKNGRWRCTKVASHRAYLNTLKPINDFLKELGF